MNQVKILKSIFFRIILFSLFFILHLSSSLSAQNSKYKANFGYGIWESFHIGADIKFNNYSVGIDFGTSFGTLPFDDNYFSVTLDNTYFIGKKNKYKLRSWYLNSRVIYWYFKDPNSLWDVIQICPSIGKEINFNKKIGINIDLGASISAYAHKNNKNMDDAGWLYPINPEFRIEIFYRFK
jgi:hypothetical protein